MTPAKHKRHRRPRDASDPTPPLFKDLPRLIYCPRKGHYRPASEFGRNKNRPSGLQPYCKACRREDAKKDRARPKSDKRLIKATMRKLDALVKRISQLRAVDHSIRVRDRDGIEHDLSTTEGFAWLHDTLQSVASVPRGNIPERR